MSAKTKQIKKKQPKKAGAPNAEIEHHPFLQYIYDNVIGKGLVIQTPYGAKEIIYCDYTASGKPLTFIEEYMTKVVHPYYGNTHTETSHVSVQTTKFRDDARELVKKSTNCTDDDVVIFTGNGVTGAIYKLMNVMELRGEKAKGTTVIVSPYEHHSNMLMWRAAGCRMWRVQLSDTGTVDVEDFKIKLQRAKDISVQIICSFSAASNVTGIKTDTHEITNIAHQHGAFMFWDYAAGAPYLDINMNINQTLAYDAVFVSPHKFVGGPGTPGLLIAKKKLFTNLRPSVAGGGTVLYVTRTTEMYLDDIEMREEGGTPAITEDIRVGLTFQLKDHVTPALIEEYEKQFFEKATSVWKKNPNLIILGDLRPARLCIFSFMVRHPGTGKFLHHNFVSTLLNDLYGIQSRGGCACAGPYGQDLMDIPEAKAWRFKELIIGEDPEDDDDGLIVMKPGFCRINLPYFFDDATAHYVIEAVDMIATHAWRLLPQYTFEVHSGNFSHLAEKLENMFKQELFSLYDISYDETGMHVDQPDMPVTQPSYDKMARDARRVFMTAVHVAEKIPRNFLEEAEDELLSELDDKHKQLLWFMLPTEALDLLQNSAEDSPVDRSEIPFAVRRQARSRVQTTTPRSRPTAYDTKIRAH